MNYSDNLIFLALFIAFAIRIAMHFVDKSRIKDEIEAKGGRVLSITWNPSAAAGFSRRASGTTPSLTATDRVRRFR